jgi:hypothetical protein
MRNQNLFACFFFLLVPYAFAEEDGVDPYKKYWMAHGICASLAWAILIPIAVGSALLRKTITSMGFPESTWFHIHYVLISTAAILTIIAFALAVHVIRAQDGFSVWRGDEVHFTVGLVIFLATLLQAMSGILRPRLAHTHNEEPDEEPEEKPDEKHVEDTEANESNHENTGDEPEKNTYHANIHKTWLRFMWECLHRLFGVGLLACAWWQIHSGWQLYEENGEGENQGNAWLGVAGGIAGTVVILFGVQVMRKL